MSRGSIDASVAPAEPRSEARGFFDAWWLPGYVPGPATAWWEIAGDGVIARAPRLSDEELAALATRLRAARRAYLSKLSIDDIVERIGAAINRWLDPFSAELYRASELIPQFTGYPEPAVRKGLAGFLGSFRAENLRRLLIDELGDPEVLDGFRPRRAGPGLTRASGPGLVLHSFAGNVPGLPAQSLVAATLAKAASLGKVASEEPVFAPLFLRALAEVDPRLGACVAVTYWPGGTCTAALQAADLIVAYGSEASIAAVRRQAEAPETGGAGAGDDRSGPARRVITYGHKLSFGVILRNRLGAAELEALAECAAYDVARYDQQGCLSPHVFYVEEGGEIGAAAFAEALARALRRWSGIIPRGRLDSGERARVADLRRQQEFRTANRGGAVLGDASDEWCVLLSPDPEFTASCLNRTIWIKPLRDQQDLPHLLAPVRRYLQTAAVAAAPDRQLEAAEILAALGIDRICPLGQMGDPPVTWHHDGRFNVLDFLRFTDLEPENSAGRWEFAHPTQGMLGW